MYLLIPLEFCKKVNVQNKKLTEPIIDMIVVSFNNDKIIEIQIDQLRKHVKDPFYLTIADNSTDKEYAGKIEKICTGKKVGYIKLPGQNYFKNSYSHGIALNWMYKNYIKKRAPVYFGFLDHDIFPVADVKLIPFLEKQPYFGLKHFAISPKNENIWDKNTPGFWYLWAGFCFFKTAALQNKKIDFMPVTFQSICFDTGGSNWQSLYSKDNPQNYYFPSWQRIKTGTGEIRQSDFVDLIDDKWVHTINGAYWYTADPKEKKIEELLNSFETGLQKRE